MIHRDLGFTKTRHQRPRPSYFSLWFVRAPGARTFLRSALISFIRRLLLRI